MENQFHPGDAFDHLIDEVTFCCKFPFHYSSVFDERPTPFIYSRVESILLTFWTAAPALGGWPLGIVN